MAFLFKTQTKEQEGELRNMIETVIRTLKQFPDDGSQGIVTLNGMVGFAIADLLDIGAAPDISPLSDQIRYIIDQIGPARILMDRNFAIMLGDLLEIGLARHKLGVTEAEDFVLH